MPGRDRQLVNQRMSPSAQPLRHGLGTHAELLGKFTQLHPAPSWASIFSLPTLLKTVRRTSSDGSHDVSVVPAWWSPLTKGTEYRSERSLAVLYQARARHLRRVVQRSEETEEGGEHERDEEKAADTAGEGRGGEPSVVLFEDAKSVDRKRIGNERDRE